MLTMQTEVDLRGPSAREVTDFMLECDDTAYAAWWPGTHREFHVVEPGPGAGHVGDRVWMDELVGSRHLRMGATVVVADPGHRIVWQLRPWRLPLPVHLALTVRDEGDHVALRHTLTAGWNGWRRVLDPVWRLYFTAAFTRELDEHARTEFPRLAELLRPGRHTAP